MKKVLLVAVLAAGLTGCIPAFAVPLIQGAGVVAVDTYCREEHADFRAKTRETFWGTKDFTIVTRDGC
ncbi:MAG: lipoprotein [Thalassobaculum sp.]